MAAEDEGRTEEPSEYKLEKARKEGRVAKSQEISSSLVLLFGNTDYIKGLFEAKGQSQTFTGTLVFICLFVGINAVMEMVVNTVVCGGVGTALYQSHILPLENKSES